MSFRPILLAPALLALALGLAHPRIAQAADGSVPKPDPPQVKLHVFPPYVQPGSLLHVSIQPGSPAMISSFFDVFFDTDARFRPAFFDVFVADDFRFRPAFFDVFVEVDLPSASMSVDPRKLSLVCGFLTRNSIELLMQMPAAGGGGGAGGRILLRRGDVMLATVPVMLSHFTSPIQHALGSGQAISSFFDIFTELSLDAGGQSLTPRQRHMLRLRGEQILRKAGEAEMRALRMLGSDDTPVRLGVELLRCLLDALHRQMMLDLKTHH